MYLILTTVLTTSLMYFMDLAGMLLRIGTFSSPSFWTTRRDRIGRPWRLLQKKKWITENFWNHILKSQTGLVLVSGIKYALWDHRNATEVKDYYKICRVIHCKCIFKLIVDIVDAVLRYRLIIYTYKKAWNVISLASHCRLKDSAFTAR